MNMDATQDAVPSVQQIIKADLCFKYEQGQRIKKSILTALDNRKYHRSYLVYLFGNNEGGYRPYKMDSNLHGLCCSDLYLDWRTRVISALSNLYMPLTAKYRFEATPSELISHKYMYFAYEDQIELIGKNLDKALGALLNIIDTMPDEDAKNQIVKTIKQSLGNFHIMEDDTLQYLERPLKLPPALNRLATHLIKNNGLPVKRNDLIDCLWGEEYSSNYLDNPKLTDKDINKSISNYVSKLNDKLRKQSDGKQHIFKSQAATHSYEFHP